MSTVAAGRTEIGEDLPPSQHRQEAIWKFCAWSGPIFIVAFLLVWAALAGWFPPPKQSWDTAAVFAFFHDNSIRIRLGMGLAVFVSGFYMLWTMAIARVMKPMEGTAAAPLAQMQTYGGIFTSLAVIFFSMIWVTGAYEASMRDTDPRIVQAFYDMGYLAFDLVGIPTIIQMSSLGVLILGRRNPGIPQFMPRWVAYLSFFVSLTFFEVLLILFIRTGPFAWDGLITYYVILGGFFGWMAVVSYFAIKAGPWLDTDERSRVAAELK